ncbi:MAG TPA: TonB-dependent receptor [Caulobacteraceae bacterium]
MARRCGNLRALLAAGASAPLLIAAVAHAQSATTPATSKAVTNVGEIVVTATRRAEALSKVPESVSAFTAAKMDIQGIKSFADVAKFTPGVSFDEDSHDITIRGIQSTAGSSTTGVYIDDTPVQARNLGFNSNNTLPAVFDLDRVEVLRGPQGTLFGAGSEGGTVRYITNQPSLTSFSGFAHGEAAWTDYGAPSYELGAAFGGPIAEDKLAFRISAWGRRDGGYIDRVNYLDLSPVEKNANRVDTYALRLAFTWAPTPNFTITPAVNFEKREQHNHDTYWTAISDPGAGDFLNGTPDRQADVDHFILPTLKVEWQGPGVAFISDTAYYARKERVNGYSGTLYNLSYFQHFLTTDVSQSIWGYPSDPNGNPCSNNCQKFNPLLVPTGLNLPQMPNYISQNNITNSQYNWTQEFRLQSTNPTSRLQWTVGAFMAFNYQRSTEEINDPMLPALTRLLWNEDMITAWGQDLLPGGDDYINDTRAHDRQIALFADATFNVTDQLKVEAGLRFAWTHFDFTNLNTGAQDLLDSGGVPATASGGKDEKPLTPKFTITYQFNPDDMAYATAAKGYRIGGATPPLPEIACGGVFPTSYNSDSVWSFEVGTKDRFLDRRLSLSGSAYYIGWSNIQQAILVTSCAIMYTTNVGSAQSKGFDLQGQWRATDNLDLELAVGYTHSTYSQSAYDNTGALLANKGDSLDVVPWSVTLGAQYNFHLFDRPAFIRADYEFNSRRNIPITSEDPATVYYDPGLVPNPATNLVSLRAGMSLSKWDFAVYVNNLFNSHPQLNLQHQDSNTLLYEAETFRPLTVGVAATFRY